MAYCVHCGVRLQEDMGKCPLCGTPVVNPKTRSELSSGEGDTGAFGTRQTIYNSRLLYNRSMFGGILTFILVISVLTTLIIDLSIHQRITWSFYAMLSIVTIWFLLVFPIVYRRKSYLMILINDIIVIGIYLLLLDNHHNGVSWGWFPALSLLSLAGFLLLAYLRKHLHRLLILLLSYADLSLLLFFLDVLTPHRWFMPLALPILSAAAILILLYMGLTSLLRRNSTDRSVYYMYTALLFIMTAIFSIAANISVSLYIGTRPIVSWAYIIIIAVSPIIILCLIVYRNHHLQLLLRKKFHI